MIRNPEGIVESQLLSIKITFMDDKPDMINKRPYNSHCDASRCTFARLITLGKAALKSAIAICYV